MILLFQWDRDRKLHLCRPNLLVLCSPCYCCTDWCLELLRVSFLFRLYLLLNCTEIIHGLEKASCNNLQLQFFILHSEDSIVQGFGYNRLVYYNSINTFYPRVENDPLSLFDWDIMVFLRLDTKLWRHTFQLIHTYFLQRKNNYQNILFMCRSNILQGQNNNKRSKVS